MRRTFFALDLEEAFLRRTLALMSELRAERLGDVRWVATHTLHVTLRFLGDTDEAQLPALVELVASLGATLAMPIEVRSTSLLAFPNPRRAHVLGLHLDDDGSIAALAGRAEQGVVALGRPPEERPFRPHLTLARFRRPADLRRLFERHPAPWPGGRLTALTFYESTLGGENGPVHTPLARHEWAADRNKCLARLRK